MNSEYQDNKGIPYAPIRGSEDGAYPATHLLRLSPSTCQGFSPFPARRQILSGSHAQSRVQRPGVTAHDFWSFPTPY